MGFRFETTKGLYRFQGSEDIMSTFRKVLEVRTQGEGDIVELSDGIRDAISESDISDGLACAFVPGSTAAIVTIEFEPGLESDLRDALERLIPKGIEYDHHRRWGDGNGHSHIRASFLSPSLTIPFQHGVADLGTWQQVVLVELDVRSRTRRVIVQITGE
jgi:secondary thiamine-phosphate synthase enzyme